MGGRTKEISQAVRFRLTTCRRGGALRAAVAVETVALARGASLTRFCAADEIRSDPLFETAPDRLCEWRG